MYGKNFTYFLDIQINMFPEGPVLQLESLLRYSKRLSLTNTEIPKTLRIESSEISYPHKGKKRFISEHHNPKHYE